MAQFSCPTLLPAACAKPAGFKHFNDCSHLFFIQLYIRSLRNHCNGARKTNSDRHSEESPSHVSIWILLMMLCLFPVPWHSNKNQSQLQKCITNIHFFFTNVRAWSSSWQTLFAQPYHLRDVPHSCWRERDTAECVALLSVNLLSRHHSQTNNSPWTFAMSEY